MQVITTHTTTLHLSATATTVLFDAQGKPISASSTAVTLHVKRSTIVVAQTAAEHVIHELGGGQHTGLPVFGGKRGLVMATAAEMVRLGLGGQRLLSAESTRA